VTEPAEPAIDLDAYDFELPEQAIAQRALAERDAARLLRLDRKDGARIAGDHDWRVRDLPELLAPGDLLVVNTTRVLSARLRGQRHSGGAAEALLLGPDTAADGASEGAEGVADPEGAVGELGAEPARRYRALVKISGHLRVGIGFVFEGAAGRLGAEIVALGERGEVVLAFEPGPSPYALGEAPLPPYIRRPTRGPAATLRAEDIERYQTVYASAPGAVAAPTAGLHLTEDLFARLAERGVSRADVTLHVGIGTFRPLGEADLRTGRLHREHFVLPQATVEAVAAAHSRGGRVIAVGTTTTRVLESCADAEGGLRAGSGETDLFLRPGSPIRVVDGLLTNFHLPRSSLLLLVAAFIGREPLLNAYHQALAEGYRFYSYGDAMLIL